MTNFAAEVPLPAASAMNTGLNFPNQRFMLNLLGSPRAAYSRDCAPPTNRRLKNLITTQDVGPFRATLIAPFAALLTQVFNRVQAEKPELYAALGTAGGLCCRLIRGSSCSWSNHSWGTSIDLTINGQLDDRGDGRTQRGLLEVYPYLHNQGVFWGAEYTGHWEDAMHWDCSQQLLNRWRLEGKI
jgi:hypothetical protein